MNFTSEQLEIFELAKHEFEQGNLGQAESLAHQILLKGGKNEELFHLLGCLSFENNKFKQAIKFFKRALELNPSYSESSVALSVLLNDLGRYDEGRIVFEEGQKHLQYKETLQQDSGLKQQLYSQHLELCDLYIKLAHWEMLLEQVKLVEKIKATPETVLKKSLALLKLKRTDEAEVALEEALADGLCSNECKIILAEIYYRSEKKQQSKKLFEEVLKDNPKHLKARQKYHKFFDSSVLSL